MKDYMARFSINCHSSIRCGGDTVLWFDPFRVTDTPHDGDVIFITHDHYDHFSPEDIRRVMRPDAIIVLPERCRDTALAAGFPASQLMTTAPGAVSAVKGVAFETVPAYNIHKPFHPQANGWVGYVVTVDSRRFYVAGDTDDIPEARSVRCDVAFLPVGGTYTMTAAEAAALANTIQPAAAVPTHYGSITGTPEDGRLFAAMLEASISCVTLL